MRWRGPFIVVGLAALLGLGTLGSPVADAGNCGYAGYYPTYSYRPAYYAPACYTPPPSYCPPAAVAVPAVKEPPVIVQPVILQEQLAPAFVFQVLSAYQQPQQGGQAYTGQQGGYGFGQQFQKPAATPASTYSASSYGNGAGKNGGLSEADLDALAARLAGKLAQRDDPVPRIGGVTPTAPAPPQQQQGQQGQGPTDGERRLIEYMATACVECHRAPSIKGGLTLFTAEGDFRPSSTRRQITPAALVEAMENDMPPSGRRADKQLLANSGWQGGR